MNYVNVHMGMWSFNMLWLGELAVHGDLCKTRTRTHVVRTLGIPSNTRLNPQAFAMAL